MESADCPYYKLLLASTRKIDNRGGGIFKTNEGLDQEDLAVEDDEGKCMLSFTSPFPDYYSFTSNLSL